MEILIIIVALLLVGGASSALHGIIKPMVDWVSPPASTGHRAWVLLVEEGELIEREILGRCPRGYATAGRTSQNNAAQQLSFRHGAAVVRHG